MKKLTNRAALFAMMRTLEQARIEFIAPTKAAARVCVCGSAAGC